MLPADSAAIGSPEQGFGLTALRGIEPFGFVRLNVPARWYDEFDESSVNVGRRRDRAFPGLMWARADAGPG